MFWYKDVRYTSHDFALKYFNVIDTDTVMT